MVVMIVSDGLHIIATLLMMVAGTCPHTIIYHTSNGYNSVVHELPYKVKIRLIAMVINPTFTIY